MNLTMLLEMAEHAHGDRVVVGTRDAGLTARELARRSRHLAADLVDTAGFLGVNSEAFPLTLFAAAHAGVPFAPLNYRLADDRLARLVERLAPGVVVADDEMATRATGQDGVTVLPRSTVLQGSEPRARGPSGDPGKVGDADDVAVMLFTSGTTGDPKAATIRHRHLASYVIGSVELGEASPDEAALVSVPPYHIAGVSAVLTNLYAGRRVVYMDTFDAEEWVSAVLREEVTHAMLVPTMLTRVLDVVEVDGEGLPSLRHLSYGGGSMPPRVIERAMAALGSVDFVNAYGLTETSSTIAVLGPDDHRRSIASHDPAERARLHSVGRPLPTVEVQVRDPDDRALGPGDVGEIWVRGDQVAGEYRGQSSSMSPDGWFPTRDHGYLDEAGFLFLSGRLDDVIVRGGENISPGEVEAVLEQHPDVDRAAAVGVPDEEWGEAVAAAIVVRGGPVDLEHVRAFVRERLRSTRTPGLLRVVEELPHNEMGKLLRRQVRELLLAEAGTRTD